ncbi:MAG: Gfo/Idh/MocA family protein [Candidatus Dormibacteraceae bacterium]
MIGLGYIHHAHAIGYNLAGAQVIAVCDAVPEVAERRAKELGCEWFTDYRKLLDRPDIGVIDVTLPHNLHHLVVKAALEAGKHTLVEKPMAISVRECEDLIETARQVNRVFTVAENTRFVAAYLEAARVLEAKMLGDVRLIRTLIYGNEVDRLRDRTLWKGRSDGSVGGVILDAGAHSFYLLKWLFGELEFVHAFANKLMTESEVEDHAVVSGRLKNGAIFSTEYTFTAAIPWGERLEVYGSQGTLIVDQFAPVPAVYYSGDHDYGGHPLESVQRDPAGWKEKSVAASVKDFFEAVRDGRPTTVDAGDGAYALHVIERAYESVSRGGVAVTC